jgi:hypothetical protein
MRDFLCLYPLAATVAELFDRVPVLHTAGRKKKVTIFLKANKLLLGAGKLSSS